MLSEQDLELLETLLDGELPEDQSDALRRRVSSDPHLAGAFERIRAERAMRQQVFSGLEPNDAQVATLVSNVRTAIRRDEIWSTRLRALRYVSGLAACIVVGFLVGRYLPYGPLYNSDGGTGVVYQQPPGAMQEVRFNANQGGFRVLLTDANGRVIAEQPFRTFDEAREFTEDLSRLHDASRPVRPMRVSDTIFTKGQF